MKQVKIDPLNVNCLRYFKILQCAPTLLAHTLDEKDISSTVFIGVFQIFTFFEFWAVIFFLCTNVVKSYQKKFGIDWRSFDPRPMDRSDFTIEIK